jgi:hypothetical protein
MIMAVLMPVRLLLLVSSRRLLFFVRGRRRPLRFRRGRLGGWNLAGQKVKE